ncbi:hypothetical protein AX16_005121 [Volvariella volvacea WC 439]|nr:hypothetical protein AX16_005121 [Volvariella volvacea WC 439]
MSLQTGLYIIRNKARPVADRHTEGLMPPWSVVTFPEGVRPRDWFIEELDGHYLIRTTDDGKLGVINLENKVAAAMQPSDKWLIERVDPDDPRFYRYVP